MYVSGGAFPDVKTLLVSRRLESLCPPRPATTSVGVLSGVQGSDSSELPATGSVGVKALPTLALALLGAGMALSLLGRMFARPDLPERLPDCAIQK